MIWDPDQESLNALTSTMRIAAGILGCENIILDGATLGTALVSSGITRPLLATRVCDVMIHFTRW